MKKLHGIKILSSDVIERINRRLFWVKYVFMGKNIALTFKSISGPAVNRIGAECKMWPGVRA